MNANNLKREDMKVSDTWFTVVAVYHNKDYSDNYMDEIPTFDEAVEIAQEYAKDYAGVYIRETTEYIYKLG